ncbi:unnamed protein product [Owenia fusiformis]|uniref:Uncharacterized protein n=1 Tax=Owenia fusiformis TaxID=6347 RepID=A0A8S4QA04_OWEFU|nr:unnamed protein product [Owenia fusiformis]
MAPPMNKSHKLRNAMSQICCWTSTETRKSWRRSNRIVPFIEPEIEKEIELEEQKDIGENNAVVDLDAIEIKYEWPEIDFNKFGQNGIYTKSYCDMEYILRMSPVYDPAFSMPKKDTRNIFQRALHRLNKRAREAKYAISTSLRMKYSEKDGCQQCLETNDKSSNKEMFSSF